MTTTLRPRSRRIAAALRVVWLLPQPVRTAHTDTTGRLDTSIVSRVPSSRKSAPAATARDARCMTCSWETSE